MGPTRHYMLAAGGAAGVLSVLAGVTLAASGCGAEPEGAWEPVGTISEEVTVCAHGAVIQGVDVSHWNGTINWTQAHGDGIEFAIAKATEADDFVDNTFTTNRQNAKAAGVVFGAYHFFRADVDGTVQANHFLSVIGSVEPGEIAPVIDMETTDGQGASTINQRALAFMEAVKSATGRVPMIYTSPSFFNSTLGAPASFGDYLLWIANWEVSCPNVPDVWEDWTVWQKADNGNVAGISGATDLDEYDGTAEELQCAGVVCTSGPCVAGVCGGGASGGTGGAGVAGGGGTASGGGDVGGTGAAAEGGAGAEGGQGATGGGYQLDALAGIPGEDSGCSCRARPASSPRGLLLGGWLAAVALLRRRRHIASFRASCS